MKKFEPIPAGQKCNWFKERKDDPKTCMRYGKDGLCGQANGPEKCETEGWERKSYV